MKALVDARQPHSTNEIWGLTIVERICTQLIECGIKDIVVVRTDNHMEWKNKKIFDQISVSILNDSRPLSEIYNSFRHETVVIADGSVMYDRRIVQHVCSQKNSVIVIDDSRNVGILKLDASSVSLQTHYNDLSEWVRSTSSILTHTLDHIDPYVPALRHRVRPEMISIRKEKGKREAESFLFRLAYKGGLDFIYQFIYRHAVRGLVRLLANTRVTPNQVTLTYLAIALTAMPFLALGHTGWGLLICLVAMIGDASDGVLARLTFQTSRLGHRLDKHSHRIYHSLWYATAGYGLSGGDLGSPVFWNGLALITIYLSSRIITGKFKDRFQISIFDITPFDRGFRYVSGARWNINMLILGTGVFLHQDIPAFFTMTLWGIIALLFWTSRHFTYKQTTRTEVI